MTNQRDRAWRLAKNKNNKHRSKNSEQSNAINEKNWKMLYIRSEKLNRAAQLGIEYPRVSNARLTLEAEHDAEPGESS